MKPYRQALKTRSRGKRTTRRARVEIVPLIDVMFLLVAFFMVLSLSMVLQQGIPVNLSHAETGESNSQEIDELVLSVNEQGKYFLQKKQMEAAELLSVLKEEAARDKSQPIVINADREAKHHQVMGAIDIVRKSGLGNLVFAVEPNES